MTPTVYIYLFLTWIILAILALLNGWFRNQYKKNLGELMAHQLSTIMFTGIVFFITYFFVKFSRISAISDLILTGIVWVILTIIFEFLFGHYVFKNSWSKLLADYNISKGRIWIIVLIALLLAPYLVYLLK